MASTRTTECATSDPRPAKQLNKSGRPPAEVVEGRELTKENMDQQNLCRTQSRESGPSALDRVREAARGDKKSRFTTLLHHVTIDLLRESYYSLKRQAAPGVDGVTWEEYGQTLEARLSDLHGRIHRGAYRAKPSRRVWIPKSDGTQRPLGIWAIPMMALQPMHLFPNSLILTAIVVGLLDSVPAVLIGAWIYRP